MAPDYPDRNARLSQAWLSAPMLIFILVIIKLILLRSFMHSLFSTARTTLQAECDTLSTTYKLVADAPVNSIKLANQLVSTSINHSINEAKKGFMNSLTAIESLVSFVFDMTLGTYSCLAISAVNIGANEALNATQSTVDLANSISGSLGKEINKGLGDLSSFINDAVGLLSEAESFFNEGDSKIKNLSLVVNRLNNLSLPVDSINSKLDSLRSDIPTYESTKSFIKDEINQPFDLLRKSFNGTSSNFSVAVSFPFSRNITHNGTLPQCNHAKLDPLFSHITGKINHLLEVALVICGIGILIGIIHNIWNTNRGWSKMVELAKSDVTSQVSATGVDSIEEVNLSKFSYLQSNTLVKYIIDRKLLSNDALRWLRFILMRPIVDLLVIGLTGIIVSLFELAFISSLKTIIHELKSLESHSNSDLQADLMNSFALWRNQVNTNIRNIETNVNSHLLGKIHQSTQRLNNTLSNFSGAMNEDIARGFNDSILYAPLKSAFACILGNKISDVERGLTWANKNSQISLPRIESHISFQLDVGDKIESTTAAAMLESLGYLRNSIRVQFIVSGIFMSIWVLYCLSYGVEVLKYKLNVSCTSRFIRNIAEKFHLCSKYDESNLEKQHHSINFLSSPRSKPHSLTIPSDSFTNICSSECEISGEDRMYHIPPELDCINLTPLSPAKRLQNRLTQFFHGAERGVTVTALRSPAQGSIHMADDPATPLKAMIF